AVARAAARNGITLAISVDEAAALLRPLIDRGQCLGELPVEIAVLAVELGDLRTRLLDRHDLGGRPGLLLCTRVRRCHRLASDRALDRPHDQLSHCRCNEGKCQQCQPPFARHVDLPPLHWTVYAVTNLRQCFQRSRLRECCSTYRCSDVCNGWKADSSA